MTNVVKLKKDRQGPDAATAPRDASPELVAARAYLNTMIELGQVISHRKKVDPALAAAMLERNQGNVPVVPADIAKYAKDMADSKWYDTGDPFAFSTDGILINGQHRAKAIIRSGVTIEAMVQFGNDPKTRFVSDVGRTNTSSRILSAYGHKNASMRLQTALWVGRITNNGFDENGDAKKLFVRNEDAVTELSKYDAAEMAEAIKISGKLSRKFRRPARYVFAALYIAFKRCDDTACQMFFDALLQEKGQGFAGECDPAFLLHKRLGTENAGRIAGASKGSRRSSTIQHICAVSIKAFNLFSAGKQVGVLRWVPEGRMGVMGNPGGYNMLPEPFPTIGGAVTDDGEEE